MCVERVEQGAQDTALWGSYVQGYGVGGELADFHHLWSGGEEILNPSQSEVFRPRSESFVIIITAVYIPPQANTDQVLRETVREYNVSRKTANPDAAFIITGDFNKANFRTIAPKHFQQHNHQHAWRSYTRPYKVPPPPTFRQI